MFPGATRKLPASTRRSGRPHDANDFEHVSRLDILANHSDFMPLSYSRLVDTPMVTNIHGFSNESIVPVYRRYENVAH